MSRKLAGLPDIEDTAFSACLAPLSDSLYRLPEAQDSDSGRLITPPSDDGREVTSSSASMRGFSIPGITPETPPLGSEDDTETLPLTLAKWRSVADEDYADFHMIRWFLTKTDAELTAAAQAYPVQILGMLARVSRLQARHAAQHQTAASLVARLHAAVLSATPNIASPKPAEPEPVGLV